MYIILANIHTHQHSGIYSSILTLPVVRVLVKVLMVAELEFVPTSGFLSSSVDPILVICVDVTLTLKKLIFPTHHFYHYQQFMMSSCIV